MRCPVDDATLVRTTRSDVEIDHCPVCRGVWLDRGELDKILAREQVGGSGREVGTGEAGTPSQAPRRGGGERVGEGEAGGMASAADWEPLPVAHGDDRRPYGDKLGEWQAQDEAAHRNQRRTGVLQDLFDF